MYSSVVLFSCGIDSFVLYKYVKECIDANTVPVYFDIKAKYSPIEKEFVKKYPEAIIDDCLDLEVIETPTAFVPNRNILLTTLAVSKYAKTVYIGGSKSDRISDNNEKCFDELSRFLTMIDGKDVVTITSPFWDVYKEDMVRWYCKDRSPMELLINTFSCYNPLKEECMYDELSDNFDKGCYQGTMGYTSRHCFKCPACFRRNAVLHGVGVSLPFFNKEVLKKYKEEFSSKVGLDYLDIRTIKTLKYIDYIEECGFIW